MQHVVARTESWPGTPTWQKQLFSELPGPQWKELQITQYTSFISQVETPVKVDMSSLGKKCRTQSNMALLDIYILKEIYFLQAMCLWAV